MSNLTKKLFFNGTSLAVILLISTRLVSACQSVICNNGFESNTCAIDKNEIVAAWYFNLSLASFVIVTTLYFARSQKGLLAVIFCFVALFSPIILRLLNGNEGCDFFATEIAKWLFYISLFPLIFQIILWIIQVKQSKVRLK